MSQKNILWSSIHPATLAIWGKSGVVHGHPLLCHMIDVGATAAAMIDRLPLFLRRKLAQGLGVPTKTVSKSAGFLVGAHDIGKAAGNFQEKWGPGWSLVTKYLPAFLGETSQHATFSVIVLLKWLQRKGVSHDSAKSCALAVAAHHGFVPSASDIAEAKQSCLLAPPQEWTDVRNDLLDQLYLTLGSPPLPSEILVEGSASMLLAGICAVSDWIGSPKQHEMPFGPKSFGPKGELDFFRRYAQSQLTKLGFVAPSEKERLIKSPEKALAKMLGVRSAKLNDTQKKAISLASRAGGPFLMVIEQAMGGGKTEAGLLAYMAALKRREYRGINILMPTQATGNQMFSRMVKFCSSILDKTPTNIQLAHAQAQINETLMGLRKSSEDLASSSWMARNKICLAAPYAVSTVDQALRGILYTKHHFNTLLSLAGKVVIIDEVHAYDAYTGELIQMLVKWLKAMECSVIIMSATLPRSTTTSIFSAWDPSLAEKVPEQSYPRITTASTNWTSVKSVSPLVLDQKNVMVHALSANLDVIGAALVSSASKGGCAAMVCNTVTRAQDLYRMVKNHCIEHEPNVEVFLFHSRMTARRRSSLEWALTGKFGKSRKGVKRPKKAIVIATQVIEQSLDIDFDVMFSDFCPIDLLLQRVGRLHRHQRKGRPKNHSDARIYVCGLDDIPFKWEFFHFFGMIYSPRTLTTSWLELRRLMSERVLANRPTLSLPADIDPLVQSVYREHLPSYGPAFDERIAAECADQDLIERERKSAAATFGISEDPTAIHGRDVVFSKGRSPAEAEEELTRTRLMEETMLVVPLLKNGKLYETFGGVVVDFSIPLDRTTEMLLWKEQVPVSNKHFIAYLSTHWKSRCEIELLENWESASLIKWLTPAVMGRYESQHGNSQSTGAQQQTEDQDESGHFFTTEIRFGSRTFIYDEELGATVANQSALGSESEQM